MKKVLQNNSKTKAYLQSLPKLYIVALYAKYGVREYAYSKKNNADGLPLVYNYYDGNGLCDKYILTSVNLATSAGIYCWTTNRAAAERIASALNNSIGLK